MENQYFLKFERFINNLSMTNPSGTFFPILAQYSISPLYTIEVAQSKKNGNSPSDGITQVKGLVPSILSTPKVGAIDGLALVPQIPMQPCLAAIKP